ncbi:ATP-binding protein [Streptomyces chumphonensis]|uniref:ATP-binding protein n=1 Tax=Streptomyces chumphonensis TaxID=1214925 RepID=UPI003D711FCD
MHEHTSTGHVWELLLPGLPEEVGRARRWTRDVLRGCPCADDAALIVTELGANAVTHTNGPAFRVTITRADQAVSVAVADAGNTTTSPRVTHADESSTHGCGLHIAALLATDLTITRDHHGHTVTAHFATKTQVTEQAPAC